MGSPELILIAALDQNRCIGRDNALPWPKIEKDLSHFRRLTKSQAVCMGRKTWESLPADQRPLSGRWNMVLSRTPKLELPKGVNLVSTLEQARSLAGDAPLWVIGGGEIYRLAIPDATRLELTHIHAVYDGDVHFPEIDPKLWDVTAEEPYVLRTLTLTFKSYRRRNQMSFAA